ncbi:hypothetical protein BJ165DRAFT_1405944 [Panaeolus papilionaceus]|nr:hypothetical protein BJ165DRAFT_1405944 [Panaeolus papilionaceus]
MNSRGERLARCPLNAKTVNTTLKQTSEIQTSRMRKVGQTRNRAEHVRVRALAAKLIKERRKERRTTRAMPVDVEGSLRGNLTMLNDMGVSETGDRRPDRWRFKAPCVFEGAFIHNYEPCTGVGVGVGQRLITRKKFDAHETGVLEPWACTFA